METLVAPPGSYRADLTARRVRGNSIGKTEKAKASGNALDMPTSVWSEMARKYAEPIPTEKANDDRRQSVDASQRRCPMEQQCISAAFSIAKWYSVKPQLFTAPRVAPHASAIGGALMRA